MWRNQILRILALVAAIEAFAALVATQFVASVFDGQPALGAPLFVNATLTAEVKQDLHRHLREMIMAALTTIALSD